MSKKDYIQGFESGEEAQRLRPIPMVLHCPVCRLQHIDAPDSHPELRNLRQPPWLNPPHRSHLCAGCGHIWRPADVPTTGVAAVQTRGKNDSPIFKADASPLVPGGPYDADEALIRSLHDMPQPLQEDPLTGELFEASIYHALMRLHALTGHPVLLDGALLIREQRKQIFKYESGK